MELGQRVRVDMRKGLRRTHGFEGWRKKVWLPIQWHRLHEIEGIVIGQRTFSNGDVDRDYEAGITYYPDTFFPVVLVAYDLNRKPVAFHPEDVTPV